jgi:hypothetical protein
MTINWWSNPDLLHYVVKILILLFF